MLGYYRCGPAAVAAIKGQNLGYSYDARFVYAEVSSISALSAKFSATQLNQMSC